MPITVVKARLLYDSHGNPAVECDVTTEKGLFRALIPSAASTANHEMRDGDEAKWDSKGVAGVLTAVNNIKTVIGPALIHSGLDETKQAEVDKFILGLDGTDNKSKLGANAILGVSIAVCKAGAGKKGIPLYRHIAELAGNKQLIMPIPAFTVLNRGSHGGNMVMQEFNLRPTGAKSFTEALRMGVDTYQNLKSVIKDKYSQEACNVGEEGGFAPNFKSIEEGLELLKAAVEMAGFTGKIQIGLDVTVKSLDNDFSNKYPILTIEDSGGALTNTSPELGADKLVTNPERIKTGIDKNVFNCLLLQVNQIGSVSESIEACKMAQKAGWGCMVSHHSGETDDSFTSDLVVGLCAGQIKTGAPCRSERLAKYNHLLRIEEELGSSAKFAGTDFQNPLKAAGIVRIRRGPKCIAIDGTLVPDADDDAYPRVGLMNMAVEVVNKVLGALVESEAQLHEVNDTIYKHLAGVCSTFKHVIDGTAFTRRFMKRLLETYGTTSASRKYCTTTPVTVSGIPQLGLGAIAMVRDGPKVYYAPNNTNTCSIDIYEEEYFDHQKLSLCYRLIQSVRLSRNLTLESLEILNGQLYAMTMYHHDCYSVDLHTGQLTLIMTIENHHIAVVQTDFDYGMTSSFKSFKIREVRGITAIPLNKCLTSSAQFDLDPRRCSDVIRELTILFVMSINGRRSAIEDSNNCIITCFPYYPVSVCDPNLSHVRYLGGPTHSGENNFCMWLDEPRLLLFVLRSFYEHRSASLEVYSMAK